MTTAAIEAMRWETGCQSDPVRNQFIVPLIVSILERFKPETILDVGTGTGYIPRTVNQTLKYRPQWTLLDLDQSRLSLASKLIDSNMSAEIVLADVLNYEFSQAFSAVIVTFTLLEISDREKFINQLPSLICDGGLFIIAVPDAWRDVLEISKGEPSIIRSFLAGKVSLPKIDKFTGKPYPFRAIRLESLISRILRVGFDLFELEEEIHENGVYLLAFRKHKPQ